VAVGGEKESEPGEQQNDRFRTPYSIVLRTHYLRIVGTLIVNVLAVLGVVNNTVNN
jgi:hypothetical protein